MNRKKYDRIFQYMTSFLKPTGQGQMENEQEGIDQTKRWF